MLRLILIFFLTNNIQCEEENSCVCPSSLFCFLDTEGQQKCVESCEEINDIVKCESYPECDAFGISFDRCGNSIGWEEANHDCSEIGKKECEKEMASKECIWENLCVSRNLNCVDYNDTVFGNNARAKCIERGCEWSSGSCNILNESNKRCLLAIGEEECKTYSTDLGYKCKWDTRLSYSQCLADCTSVKDASCYLVEGCYYNSSTRQCESGFSNTEMCRKYDEGNNKLGCVKQAGCYYNGKECVSGTCRKYIEKNACLEDPKCDYYKSDTENNNGSCDFIKATSYQCSGLGPARCEELIGCHMEGDECKDGNAASILNFSIIISFVFGIVFIIL